MLVLFAYAHTHKDIYIPEHQNTRTQTHIVVFIEICKLENYLFALAEVMTLMQTFAHKTIS